MRGLRETLGIALYSVIGCGTEDGLVSWRWSTHVRLDLLGCDFLVSDNGCLGSEIGCRYP